MNDKSEIPTNKEDTKEKKPSFFKEFIKFAFIALIVVVPIRVFIAQPFIVSGSSMYPTFESGEYLIVDQISYNFNEPKRGDVIVFKFPDNPSKYFIKRIIGLPGETVILSGNTTKIIPVDGEEFILKEPYVQEKQPDSERFVLEEDEYFVMGDNRDASLDSRSWGPLTEDGIVGRAYTRLLPINKIDYLPGEYRQK
jgi:signal peptidase I